jgi:hypothetical protein
VLRECNLQMWVPTSHGSLFEQIRQCRSCVDRLRVQVHELKRSEYAAQRLPPTRQPQQSVRAPFCFTSPFFLIVSVFHVVNTFFSVM